MPQPDCSLSLQMLAYLPYGELERNKDAISRFGSGLKAIKAISRALP
jgi:type II restriction enzyme